MGLFRRKKQDEADLASRFVLGTSPPDPALDAGVDAVREGHLLAGQALLGETRTASPELRAERLLKLREAAIGRSDELFHLAAEQQDNPDLWLWFGSTMIGEAWAIRGGGYASGVGEDRFKMFFTTLVKAHDPLRAAAQLLPGDATPWSELLTWAMGMQRREDADEFWRECSSRCSTHWHGHWTRLQILCDKWHGSHEEMYAFARETVRRAPEGHPLVAMLPLAHAEYRLRALTDGPSFREILRLNNELYSADHIAELKAAGDKWRAAMRPHLREIEAHHYFGAYYFHAIAHDETDDTKVRARWHLTQAGARVAEVPWGYEGDALEEFAAALKKLKLPLPPVRSEFPTPH